MLESKTTSFKRGNGEGGRVKNKQIKKSRICVTLLKHHSYTSSSAQKMALL
jgi:hypothetical protein